MEIPGFEIIQKLGQGGMATVYKARQVSLDRMVAIKVLSSKFAQATDDIERFRTEAQVAARLKHPGIVQVYDAGIAEGVYYFVMEYIAGYTTGDWVRRKGQIPEKEVLLVIEHVAQALDYAWTKSGIVHCDIKPDNVMVDADGQVKVADLGLARTISAMKSEAEIEEVLGTPAFMSPEQAMGEADLDCRADIYSLGAMAYQLLTGKYPFHEHPEDLVMELQVTGTIPDVVDLAPGTGKGTCRLVEKMMMKSRDQRQANWQEVVADIHRARRGLPPHGMVQVVEGASTVRRNAQAHHHAPRVSAVQMLEREHERERARPWGLWIGLAVLLAAAAGMAVFFLRGARPAPLPNSESNDAAAAAPAPDAAATDPIRAAFEEARKWEAANPGEYTAAVNRYNDVYRRGMGSPYSAMARQAADRLTRTLGDEVAKIMARLEEQAAAEVAAGRPDAAAAVFRDYAGRLAAESREHRLARGSALLKLHEEQRQAQAAQERATDELLGENLRYAAMALASGQIDDAAERLAGARTDTRLASRRDAIDEALVMVGACRRASEYLGAAFVARRGEEITVRAGSQSIKFTLEEVMPQWLRGSQRIQVGSALASKTVQVPLAEIPLDEQLNWLRGLETNGCASARGMLCLAAGDPARAAGEFAAETSAFGKLVADVLGNKAAGTARAAVRAALQAALARAGVQVSADDLSAWPQALAGAVLPVTAAETLAQAVIDVRAGPGADDPELQAVLQAIDRVVQRARTAGVPAAGGAPGRGGAGPRLAMRAELAQLMPALAAANPGLRTEQVHASPREDGRMALHITSAHVTDLSPLAGAEDLADLRVVCPTPTPGRLRDIEALRGMALVGLELRNWELVDITPLKGMALESLSLQQTAVKDVSVLRGMASLRSLNLSGTKVYDFSPLAGLPLLNLSLAQTQVKQVAFIDGMPLESLDLEATSVYEFDRIGRLPLVNLNLCGTQIRDLRVLQRLQLRRLALANTPVNDIALLAGHPLEMLNLGNTTVENIAVVMRMPQMKELYLHGTRVRDIAPLKGLPLTRLRLDQTRVADLAPLAGMKLEMLNIEGTRVTDIAVVAGMPLNSFWCRQTEIRDFAPLDQAPVVELWIDNPQQHGWLIRSLRQLRWLNGLDILLRRL